MTGMQAPKSIHLSFSQADGIGLAFEESTATEGV
jgi:hypothetical protein